MKKYKLPKDWITVNSKSHPDRVYYFNVKTNQSTWKQPTLDRTKEPSEHIDKRRKNYDETEERSRAMTPEYNLTEGEAFCQQISPSNVKPLKMAKRAVKEKETLQMKVLREKMLQRKLQKSAGKTKIRSINQGCDLASVSLTSSSLRLTENDKVTVSSPKKSYSERNNKISCLSSRSSSSRLAGNDKLVISLNENDANKTFTPQMHILYEKIQRRNLDTSSADKMVKTALRSKQHGLKTINQTSKTQVEKKEKTIPNRTNVDRNKRDIVQNRNNGTKKNLAKERMRKLRKSLNLDKSKLEKIDCSVITEKSSQGLGGSLSISQGNKSLGSTSIYRNVEIRLKRLHNKVLKNATYEKSITSNNDKLHIQQSKEPIIHNMTKDKLLEQANREVLYEEMDWEPMKDEEITLEVEVIRTQLGKQNCTDVTNYASENAIELTQPLESQKKNSLYIVFDTNVFLSNLEIIEEARDATFKTYPRPFIVIPWTVIRELDYLKDNKSRSETLRAKARKAISFLNKHFSSKHPRIVGQTREQAAKNKEDFSLECPDDEILQCCLQIRGLRKSVVLLSYDKNLCTKAMIYDIVALGRHDPLEKIDMNASDKTVNFLTNGPVEYSHLNEELHLSDDIFEDAKAVVKKFLSAIIVKQMSDIYGPDWEMFVIIKPPWTIITALKCAIKHWIAAISESFQKRHSVFILKELLQAFEYLPAGGRRLQDVEHILEKCSDLIQTINADKHYELMAQSFNSIRELKKKCLEYIADMDQKTLHNKIGIAENVQEQEHRAEKAFQCFKQIYSYARDLCGLAAGIAGITFPLNFNPINPQLPPATIKHLQPEMTRKVNDLTQNLNKLLVQDENCIKYQTLLTLQQNLNTFFAHTETVTFDVELLDIYYCIKLKEDVLRMGLRQLQELNTYYCMLVTCT